MTHVSENTIEISPLGEDEWTVRIVECGAVLSIDFLVEQFAISFAQAQQLRLRVDIARA